MTWIRSRRHGLAALSMLAICVALAMQVHADVKLPKIFGHHMVLQQQSEVTIWGWERPGQSIQVIASWGDEAEGRSDEQGRWSLVIPTPDAGGPHQITVTGSTTVVLRDVLIGEVWICSGQSNMEMPLGNIGPGYSGVESAEEAISAADHPRIRLFTVQNTFCAHRRIDVEGSWQACSPETARTFSATAYYFGRALHQHLGIPIGLVAADWGGTVAESWMNRESVEKFPAFGPQLEFIDVVKDPNTRLGAMKTMRDGWWSRLDAGAPNGWKSASFEDSGWKTMLLPATLGPDGLDGFDGVLYFRRTIDLPAALADQDAVLELGPIDDYDDVWVNGTRVGGIHEPGRWNLSRSYPVKASLLEPGPNTIAVRMLDTSGPGGINGRPEQMVLLSGNDRVSVSGRWSYHRGPTADQLPPMPQTAGLHQNLPTTLFNGMIAPLTRFAIRGVIWYQGESNRGRAEQYRTLFRELIRCWRREWSQGDFPFYFVQIAPYGYRGDRGQTAALREAQLLALGVPNTGMAVTMDIGDPRDIHPKNKKDEGERLARWALARTYHAASMAASGPLYESMRIEAGAIRIHFRHVGGGLELRESGGSHFIIAGRDRRFFPARVRIDKDTLVLESPEVPRPVSVRYAWEAASEPNFFNSHGLPASPFRTDDWSPALRARD